MSCASLRALAVSVVVAAGCWAFPASSQDSEPPALELACSQDGDESVDLLVTLVNASDEHMAVPMGVRLGNGRSYLATSLVVEAKSGQSNAFQRFEFLFGHIAGRSDPWVVPLPAGSKYTITVDLSDFYSSEGHGRLSDLAFPVDVVLRLESRQIPDIAFLEGYIGTVRSSQIAVPRDCAYGA